MTQKVHAKRNRRRLWGASAASEGHSTLLPWQRRPPLEKLCFVVVVVVVVWHDLGGGGPALGCKINNSGLAHHMHPFLLLLLLISIIESAGERQRCMFSPELSLILSFPPGKATHTQPSSCGLKNSLPGCVEAKVAGVSPLRAILQYVTRVWVDGTDGSDGHVH